MFFDWDRVHQLSTYATVGVVRGHPKWVQLRTGRRGVALYVYVRTYTISFHVLTVFLSYGVLFYLQTFKFTFIQKRCVHHKRLFLSNRISFCRHEITFFLLKLFLLSKLAKALLISIEQNLRYTLYNSMIPYFEKTLCNVAQEIR